MSKPTYLLIGYKVFVFIETHNDSELLLRQCRENRKRLKKYSYHNDKANKLPGLRRWFKTRCRINDRRHNVLYALYNRIM